jgi:hypothetical protein
MTNLERETIILFNEAEDTAEVYTHNKSMIKKLDAMCLSYSNDVYCKLFDENRKPQELSLKRKEELANHARLLTKQRIEARQIRLL